VGECTKQATNPPWAIKLSSQKTNLIVFIRHFQCVLRALEDVHVLQAHNSSPVQSLTAGSLFW
jgi:hypothetical protein